MRERNAQIICIVFHDKNNPAFPSKLTRERQAAASAESKSESISHKLISHNFMFILQQREEYRYNFREGLQQSNITAK